MIIKNHTECNVNYYWFLNEKKAFHIWVAVSATQLHFNITIFIRENSQIAKVIQYLIFLIKR